MLKWSNKETEAELGRCRWPITHMPFGIVLLLSWVWDKWQKALAFVFSRFLLILSFSCSLDMWNSHSSLVGLGVSCSSSPSCSDASSSYSSVSFILIVLFSSVTRTLHDYGPKSTSLELFQMYMNNKWVEDPETLK